MKVKELIEILNNLNPECTIEVAVPYKKDNLGWYRCALCDLEKISETVEMDTNKLYYTIELTNKSMGRVCK